MLSLIYEPRPKMIVIMIIIIKHKSERGMV
jgi:hypothetical protein